MPIQHWSERIWVVEMADDPQFAEEMDILDSELRSRLDESDERAADHAARSAEGQTGPDAGKTGIPAVVVDLAKVSHVNSSNLSQLLRLRKLLVEHDSRLILAGAGDGVGAVFASTGLDKVFRFAPDHAIALAEIQIQA